MAILSLPGTASPVALNLTPDGTTADDVGVYAFAERHDSTLIMACE